MVHSYNNELEVQGSQLSTSYQYISTERHIANAVNDKIELKFLITYE